MVRPKFVRAAVKDGEVIKEYPTEVINPKICSDRTLTQIRDILEKKWYHKDWRNRPEANNSP